MRKARLILGVGCLLVPRLVEAFDPLSRTLEPVEQGNQLYREQHYDRALEQYEQAEQLLIQEPRVHFNRGGALFKLGRPLEAREAFLQATGTEDPQLKKRTYYNIGNTFLAEGAFADAVSYYRRALEIDSGYEDARFNLELALQALKQQQQAQKDSESGKPQSSQNDSPDQKEPKSGKEQPKQPGDQNQPPDQEEGKKPADRKPDQPPQEQQPEKQPPGQPEGPPEPPQEKPGEQPGKESAAEDQPQGSPADRSQQRPGQLSRKEFEDLLEAMRDNEKPFQMYRFVLPEFKKDRVEKDW